MLATCPSLVPLTGPDFGETTMKLIDVAGLYHACRNAALACALAPEKD